MASVELGDGRVWGIPSPAHIPSLHYTDQLKATLEIRATEGTNILEHLSKLKKNWDKLTLFSDHNKLMGDAFFKRVIAQSLPRSWNAFTNPFV